LAALAWRDKFISEKSLHTGHVSSGGFKLTSRSSFSLHFVQDLLSRCFAFEPSAKIAERKGFVTIVFLGTRVIVQHKTIPPTFHARTLTGSGAALSSIIENGKIT
jgi:hypothetical protein